MMFHRRWLFATVLVAGAIRGLVAWFGLSDLDADPDSYTRLAETWARTGTYGFESEAGVTPTAFRPPLYPWLLSWLVAGGQVSRAAVAGLHVALGCATVALTFLIGCRLQLRWAWIAALAIAIDPLLLRQSQLVMTETLATCLGALAWWLWLIALPVTNRDEQITELRSSVQWFAIVGFGVALGVSILARPTAAPWALLCAGFALFVGGTTWKRRVIDCALICLGVLVCVVPWTLRNYSALGRPIWATTHGGYTLLLANNPPLYRHFSKEGASRAWQAEDFQEALTVRVELEEPPLNELTQDDFMYQAASMTILRQPQLFLLSCIYRVGWLFALWPYDGSFGVTEGLIGIWYAVVFYFAYIGFMQLWRNRSLRGWWVGLLLIFSLVAVHAIFWSNMRMRAPAMPCILLLAVAAAQSWQLRGFLRAETNNRSKTLARFSKHSVFVGHFECQEFENNS